MTRDAVSSFLWRLAIGGAAWAAGSFALFLLTGFLAWSSGGSMAIGLVFLLPWTAVVAWWMLRPLFVLPLLEDYVSRVLAVAGLTMAILVCTFVGVEVWIKRHDRQQARERAEAIQRRLEELKSPYVRHFAKVCRNAGRSVTSRAAHVSSVAFEGVRPRTATRAELADPQFRGDVYSGFDTGSNPGRELAVWLTNARQGGKPGYSQVEIRMDSDSSGGFRRYAHETDGQVTRLDTREVDQPSSQYLVRIEDISTPEDREHWVGGTRWTIVDRKSGATMAESVAYAIDLGQGSPHGDMAPWQRAGHPAYRQADLGAVGENACPAKTQGMSHLDFVYFVLTPAER